MSSNHERRRVLIMGAAGRDFHDFNVVYRDDPGVEVVAFTATQIPGVADRRYPPELAGPHYPEGIPIEEEDRLEELIDRFDVDEVVFAYSDVPHIHVMHAASRAGAAGADFTLLGPRSTMLKSSKPVIAVTSMRTGCGKSQTSRWLSRHLRERELRAAVLRHPMPYGDLAAARVQRFATLDDLAGAHCTAEEREEYEPHIAVGNVVYAGVDYAAILAAAEEEADVVIWDGGNNDFSFLVPDLDIAIVDALRPSQMDHYHPGEMVVRMADVVVVNKVDAAPAELVEEALERVAVLNPTATVVKAASPVRLDDPEAVTGRKVIVVDDGPTITHGGMPYGAGFAAAVAAGAGEIVDPRDSAVPEMAAIYEAYPHIDRVLPAVGYSDEQLSALAETINRSDAELVVSGTPIDLAALIDLDKPVVRARYDYADAGLPTLASVVDRFLKDRGLL